MSVSDDRLSPGTFYINWPQVQLIRSPKLEPCSLGSVNVTAGESESFRGVSAAHLCNETPYLFLFSFIFYWKNCLEGLWGEQFLYILFFYKLILYFSWWFNHLLASLVLRLNHWTDSEATALPVVCCFIPEAISFLTQSPPTSSIFISLQYSLHDLTGNWTERLTSATSCDVSLFHQLKISGQNRQYLTDSQIHKTVSTRVQANRPNALHGVVSPHHVFHPASCLIGVLCLTTSFNKQYNHSPPVLISSSPFY